MHIILVEHSVRKTVSLFQEKIMAPSKLYHKKLMQLSSEQCVAGNRDGVGCWTSVFKKIASEARLMEADRDLIVSL